MAKNKVDFIIVGQGLAGTLLAWELIKKNQRVLIVDSFNPAAASQVAAGIYLPVTGRRIVKSWMADTLIPYAEKTFEEIEKETSTTFLFKKTVLEIFDSLKTYNDWQTRLAEKEINRYAVKFVSQKDIPENLIAPFGGIVLQHSGFVNTSVFLCIMRNYFLNKKMLLEENFLLADLNVTNVINWKNTEATKIIFCEGVFANQNPFFKNLPWLFSKGEILTIKSQQLPEDFIINQKIFILPTGENFFKIGSTYSWDNVDITPTEKAKAELIAFFKNITTAPFEIVHHQASIRPTVQGRRPFIGLHPTQTNVGIFNGFGTKGVMLAPFFAHEFALHLTTNSMINEETDIGRYKYLLLA